MSKKKKKWNTNLNEDLKKKGKNATTQFCNGERTQLFLD